MITLVVVERFCTGRMELRLKTGLRASSRAGLSGREQFSMAGLHGASTARTRSMCECLSYIQGERELIFYLTFNYTVFSRVTRAVKLWRKCHFLKKKKKPDRHTIASAELG